MRAVIGPAQAGTAYAAEAAAIVRSCVHCGFCNATCPTYQLTGDELEGPRGRIYLIKSLLEDGQRSPALERHLDQCLVCRNCETTCPSGVRYGRLLELVRPHVLPLAGLPWRQRWLRRVLLAVLPHRARFACVLAAGRLVRPLLPARLRVRVPPRPRARDDTAPVALPAPRRVALLGGCVQPALNPGIDRAARRVFAQLGIAVVTAPGGTCCGALAHHLGAEAAARAQARANIDAWWPLLEDGVEAVVATASGCGVQLKDYATLLADDATYAARAAALAARVRDPLELCEPAAYAERFALPAGLRVVVQTPCTLQHGQRLGGRIEAVLAALGCTVQQAREAHLCCGSAGVYSVLHPATGDRLRTRKLGHLMAQRPDVIVTANIGCQTHLGATAPVAVRHWLELLADYLPANGAR